METKGKTKSTDAGLVPITLRVAIGSRETDCEFNVDLHENLNYLITFCRNEYSISNRYRILAYFNDNLLEDDLKTLQGHGITSGDTVSLKAYSSGSRRLQKSINDVDATSNQAKKALDVETLFSSSVDTVVSTPLPCDDGNSNKITDVTSHSFHCSPIEDGEIPGCNKQVANRETDLDSQEKETSETSTFCHFKDPYLRIVQSVYIRCQVGPNSENINALVATGSEMTMMSIECVKKLGLVNRVDLYQCSSHGPMGILRFVGRLTDEEVCFGNSRVRTNIYIAAGLQVEMAIGLDILQSGMYIVDFSQNSLVSGSSGDVIPMYYLPEKVSRTHFNLAKEFPGRPGDMQPVCANYVTATPTEEGEHEEKDSNANSKHDNSVDNN